MAFAPDGKTVVAGGADNRIRVWSVTRPRSRARTRSSLTRFAHEGAILNLAFSADGKTLDFDRVRPHGEDSGTPATLTELRLLEKQPDWSPGAGVARRQPARARPARRLARVLRCGHRRLRMSRPRPLSRAAATAAAKGDAAKAKRMARPSRPRRPACPTSRAWNRAACRAVRRPRSRSPARISPDIKAVKFAQADAERHGHAARCQGHERRAGGHRGRQGAAFAVRSSASSRAAGESAKKKLLVDYLPQIVAGKPWSRPSSTHCRSMSGAR